MNHHYFKTFVDVYLAVVRLMTGTEGFKHQVSNCLTRVIHTLIAQDIDAMGSYPHAWFPIHSADLLVNRKGAA